MKNNTTAGLTIFNSLLIIALTLFITLKFIKNENKIVYINNIKVFENFNMTKELKKLAKKNSPIESQILILYIQNYNLQTYQVLIKRT